MLRAYNREHKKNRPRCVKIEPKNRKNALRKGGADEKLDFLGDKEVTNVLSRRTKASH